ncbi:hypothetical protein TYRP_002064 [Tyrophagus putrescentiae]|nr:hypothetical protein TYRP_002064 [Tyrophagus putrescentiae]
MRLTALLLLAFQGLLVSAETPVFSTNYVVTGQILLPYAEIVEPFTAYYSADANKSRIDYYDDLMQTVQRPDINQFYKLAYMVNGDGDAVRVCFNMAGTTLSPVSVQGVLPDLSNFQLKAKGVCRKLSSKVQAEGDCEAWEYRVTYGQKDNKYLFILRRDSQNQPIPIYYLMFGYDSLLGSHYDKYEVIYDLGSYKTGPIDPKVFDIYMPYKCTGFPGPGHQNVALMNPMREFIHGDRTHIDQSFDEFMAKHNKSYVGKDELSIRAKNYLHNYRYVMSENRRSFSFKVGINHLADRSDDELRVLRGRQNSNTTFNGAMTFDKSKYDLSKVPANWDWRLLGAVTPVKDQAICGSCTTGTIEGVYFVKTGNLLRLSQQQLIDCSWSEANNGCDGGEDFRSYEYIMKVGGISTEDAYGPYLGVDGRCHDKAVKKAVKVTGFYNVTQYDPEAMRVALFNNGPVTVSIDASQKSFTFYSHGIYYDPKCSSKDLDHSVLAVGYGELKGEKYWLIKNSWSTYWGNDGYVLINQKNNNCGVLTDATFPVVE